MKEVISVNNMRLSDKACIASGTPSLELMYRAAMGVYQNVGWYGSIAIFTGSGNNAGDGFALALILKENNYSPTIVLCSDKRSADGEYYYNKCREANIEVISFNAINNRHFDIGVDCLLGTGFKGDIKDSLIPVVDYINSLGYVASVDINSGLNGDTGLTNKAVVSDKTISIGYLKPGLFLNKAKDYIKEVCNTDIGIKRVEKPYYLIEASDLKEIVKKRANDSNKGSYGYVGIMGGSYSYPGAPRLASLGQTALYSGCGVSKLIVPDAIYDLIFKNVLEVTIDRISSANGSMVFNESEINRALKGLKALGIGVGWGRSEEYKKILEYILLNYDIPVVIDADGLNTLSEMSLDILKEAKAKIILTPHLKELSRLTGYSISNIKENLIEYGRKFSDKYKVVLLIKGPTTLVFDQNNTYLIDKGCPGMATAGSGDVLTGVLVGTLGRFNSDLGLATAAAAYINGLAGELAEEKYGDISMVASSTQEMLALAIKKIREN